MKIIETHWTKKTEEEKWKNEHYNTIIRTKNTIIRDKNTSKKELILKPT